MLLTADSFIGDGRRLDTEHRMGVLHLGCFMPTNCFQLSLLPGALIRDRKNGLLRGGGIMSELQLSDFCVYVSGIHSSVVYHEPASGLFPEI